MGDWQRVRNEVLSIQWAAKEAGLAPSTLRRTLRRGDLPTTATGIRRGDLDRWVKERRVKASEKRAEAAAAELHDLLMHGWTPEALAAVLGSTPTAVRRWRTRGVPQGRLHALVAWSSKREQGGASSLSGRVGGHEIG